VAWGYLPAKFFLWIFLLKGHANLQRLFEYFITVINFHSVIDTAKIVSMV
jgi:hypothetical protein